MCKMMNEKMICDFLKDLYVNEKSAATIRKYEHDVQCFYRFVGTKEVTKELVLEYKVYLEKEYAVTSANSMLASLNSFFHFMEWVNLCVKQFKVQKKVFCPRNRELSKKEYDCLISTAYKHKKTQLALIIQTLCVTGIRISELKYITVDAVECGEVEVSCKGKTRLIFLSSKLRKKLKEYIVKNDIVSGSVFLTKSGSPLDRSNIWKSMKQLSKLADIDPNKVFPHNLRHLFARTFYELEKDIAKLADVLGHSSINTTRIYIMTTADEYRRKIEKLCLIQ